MKKNFPFERARGLVALTFVIFVVVGLALRAGTGTLSAWGFGSIAAVCPLGSLEALLGAKELMLHPILLLAAVVLIVVLVGKAFCSWLCPVPWLRRFLRPKRRGAAESAQVTAEDASTACECTQDAEKGAHAQDAHAHIATPIEAEAIPTETSLTHADGVLAVCETAAEGSCGSYPSCALAPVGGKRDGVKLDMRHAVLAGALGSTAVFGFPVFCLVCPIGLTFATIVGLWNLFKFNAPSWGLLIAPIILVLEVVLLRKWCTKICPVSALLSLISSLNATFKPKVDGDACLREQGVNCHVCIDTCPEQVDPHSGRIPECTKCGVCVQACPVGAIKMRIR